MTTEREDVGKLNIYIVVFCVKLPVRLFVYRHDTFSNILVLFGLKFTFVFHTKIHVPQLLWIFTHLMQCNEIYNMLRFKFGFMFRNYKFYYL